MRWVAASKSWFALGRAGPFVPLPQRWEGWATLLGLVAPSAVFALLCGYYGRLLAVGLIAFAFGLAYAMAEEDLRLRAQIPCGRGARRPTMAE